ncbi:AMP-binding protein [Halopseudomonas pelagia]|uniref:AMP-binding protein n=1 Tax=Halopseudomonas pelagia TaxID=553151 RepID=UPI0030DC52E6|tara:strand:- start:32192 stop:33874 length:1683 start_codon:yes stop_codon:yes gene_type:complete
MGEQVRLTVSSALEAFYQREAKHPDKIYLVQPLGDGSVENITWGQAGQEARRIASYLRSLDFPERSHIALISKNCAHWIIADLAIWMAGHISVPLYPNLTADSTRQILDHSEARAVFVGKLDDWESMRPGIPPNLPMLGLPLAPQDPQLLSWQCLLQANEPMQGEPLPDPEQLATIVYTSGTTGMPKGVMLSFASMYFSANNCLRLFNISDQDRLLSYLPLCHVAERQFVEVASLLAGETVFFADNLETFQRDMQRARPTVFFGVPRIWVKFHMGVISKIPSGLLDNLLKIPVIGRVMARKVLTGLGLDQIRYAVCGAAPVADTTMAWYRRLGLNIAEVYGMTENCGYSHLGRPSRFKPGWIGLPNPGVESRLSAEGELQVRSRATMLGYFKEPEKTAETLTEDGFLCTGDVGEIDNEGYLRLTGRIKDIFKTSKGKYVAPAPIENLLAAHSRIEQVCVVGNNLGQPLALLQLSAAGQQEAEQNREQIAKTFSVLLDEVNSMIDRHEQLSCLVVVEDNWAVENGFMTPTLKIKRNVVEATYQDQFELWSISGHRVLWQEQ